MSIGARQGRCGVEPPRQWAALPIQSGPWVPAPFFGGLLPGIGRHPQVPRRGHGVGGRGKEGKGVILQLAGRPAPGRVFWIPAAQWVRVGTGGRETCRDGGKDAVALAWGGMEGPVHGEGACGGEEGRLCQPSSLGVVGRSRCLGGRY